MRVYLSSPYEANRADQIWKTQSLMAMQRVNRNITTVDPCPGSCKEHDLAEGMKDRGEWLGFYAFCANIVEGDLAMLRQCQGMIAYLPHGAVTFGTTHEIVYALQNNIPIVLVMPEGVDKVSRWLWGLLGPNRLFDNVEEAAEVLAKRMAVSNGDDINGEVYYPSWQKASR